MIEFWKFAWKNLRRNPRRNFATVLSIAFGVVGLLMFNGYVNRVDNFLRVYTIYALRTGHIAIYKKEGFEKFSYQPQKYSYDAVEQSKIDILLSEYENKIEFFNKRIAGSGLAGNGCQSFPFAASSVDILTDKKIIEHREMLQWAPELSRFIQGRGLWEYSPEMNPLALSKGLARLLNKPMVYDDFSQEDSLIKVLDCTSKKAKNVIQSDSNIQLLSGTWQGSLSALDGEVVAHFSTGFSDTDQGGLLAPLPYLQNLFDTDHISSYAIWIKDTTYLDKLILQLKTRFEAEGISADVYSWHDESLSPTYNGALKFLYVMVGFIGVVLSIIISLSILNASTMTVTERSSEIGMMKALGFTEKRICLLFIQESLILGGLGLLGGLFIGSIS
ncbi:MAG: hypothetical protein KDD35_11540, partial [Bdellovibrionales bacterium]|nr:hypothetical protein [Bdellovibrionales bacterium]